MPSAITVKTVHQRKKSSVYAEHTAGDYLNHELPLTTCFESSRASKASPDDGSRNMKGLGSELHPVNFSSTAEFILQP